MTAPPHTVAIGDGVGLQSPWTWLASFLILSFLSEPFLGRTLPAAAPDCSLADQHRGLQSFPTCPDSILPSHSLTIPHNPLQSPLLTCSLNTCLSRLLCQNSLLLSLRPVPPIVCLKIQLDYLMIEFLPTSVSCLSKLWSENLLQI